MKEEVLFTFLNWDYREMPCTLITYDNGQIDLHAPTGEGHRGAIIQAALMLKDRGLQVGEMKLLDSSGMYYPVYPFKKE